MQRARWESSPRDRHSLFFFSSSLRRLMTRRRLTRRRSALNPEPSMLRCFPCQSRTRQHSLPPSSAQDVPAFAGRSCQQPRRKPGKREAEAAPSRPRGPGSVLPAKRIPRSGRTHQTPTLRRADPSRRGSGRTGRGALRRLLRSAAPSSLLLLLLLLLPPPPSSSFLASALATPQAEGYDFLLVLLPPPLPPPEPSMPPALGELRRYRWAEKAPLLRRVRCAPGTTFRAEGAGGNTTSGTVSLPWRPGAPAVPVREGSGLAQYRRSGPRPLALSAPGVAGNRASPRPRLQAPPPPPPPGAIAPGAAGAAAAAGEAPP